MNAELSALCDRIVAALLNGTAQGLLLVLFAAGLLRFHRGFNAATRYAIAFGTILLLALLPLIHLAWEEGEPLIVTSEVERGSIGRREVIAQEDVRIPSNESPVLDLRSRFDMPAYAGEILVAFVLFISGFRLAMLGVQLIRLRVLKRTAGQAPEPVRELFSKLCVELKVTREPQLRLAPGIPAPMVAGFARPAVLLTPELGNLAEPKGLETILRHELAHVVRRDDWANLVQQVIRAVFFFHPGVAWLSRRITIDREIACDDHVLEALQDRKAYASTLTEFASRSQGGQAIAAPAAWSQQSQLKQRINMILDTKRNNVPRLSRGKAGLFALAAVILAAIAFEATPRFTFAQTAAADAAPAAVPEATETPEVSGADAAPAIAPRKPRAPKAANFGMSGGGGGVFALAGDEKGESNFKPGPARAKGRVSANDDAFEQRLERLEKLVEKLARKEAGPKEFQFELKDKFNPNFNLNFEEFSKVQEKINRDVQKMADKAMKDAAKRGLSEKQFEGESMNVRRKALEEQRRVLEKQMNDVRGQIQRLERDHARMERERERAEERRHGEEKRAEQEDEEKEKEAPKP